MDTDTTHLICSPSRPSLPTVFMTSRSRSESEIASGRSQLAEFRVECFTGFDLRAVDEQSVHSGERLAVLVIVPEQLKMSKMFRALFAILFAFPSSDPFVDQLRARRIVADDDEN